MSNPKKIRVVAFAKWFYKGMIETFKAEKMNSPEVQRSGWQAILENFKKYAETNYIQTKWQE